MHPLGGLPGEQDLRRRAGGHRQRGADRHGVAQPAGALGRGDADPASRRRAGRAARSPRSRPAAGSGPAAATASSRSSPAAAASSASRGPEHEPALARPGQQRCRSRATASRCAVGRARPVRLTSSASVAGPGARAEDGHRFVEDADAARLFHTAILPSRYARRKIGPR